MCFYSISSCIVERRMLCFKSRMLFMLPPHNRINIFKQLIEKHVLSVTPENYRIVVYYYTLEHRLVYPHIVLQTVVTYSMSRPQSVREYTGDRKENWVVVLCYGLMDGYVLLQFVVCFFVLWVLQIIFWTVTSWKFLNTSQSANHLWQILSPPYIKKHKLSLQPLKKHTLFCRSRMMT